MQVSIGVSLNTMGNLPINHDLASVVVNKMFPRGYTKEVSHVLKHWVVTEFLKDTTYDWS